jgi:hypothetical protein
MSVQEIILEFRTLSFDERKQLIKLLIDSTTEPQIEDVKTHSILEFEGIAADLADNEDPQDYVNRLRSEWGNRP